MKKTELNQEIISILRSLKTREDVNPSILYKETTKVRLMNLISDEKSSRKNKHVFVFFRNPALAFRTVGIFLLILLVLSTGTILAAQSANPKDKLFPIKLASEQIALKLSPTASLKGNVAVKIAKRRGIEIASQQKTNNVSEIKQEIEKYKESINQAKLLIPSDDIHLNNELKNEENNLDELTRVDENSGHTEDKADSEQKVKDASDSRNNSSEQNNSETKPVSIQQATSSGENSQDTKSQSSFSDGSGKTAQDNKSDGDGNKTPNATSNPKEGN